MAQLDKRHAALVALVVIGAVLFAPLASAAADNSTAVDDSATGTATASADETPETPLRHGGCDESTATDEGGEESTLTEST